MDEITDSAVPEKEKTKGVTWIDPTPLVETTATVPGLVVGVSPSEKSPASLTTVTVTMAGAHGPAVGTARTDDVGSHSTKKLGSAI